MIVYFADRQLNIIGQASTELPKGLTITDDLVTDDVETGVSIFEFKMPFDAETRIATENMAAVGNYVLRSEDGEGSLYQIIESEAQTKKQRVYVYAEDDGMDLLNEVVGEYAADKAYPISHYVNKYAASAGFVIGVNEAADLTRKLSWDGETNAAARIASVATQFDGCEVSYSFKVDGLNVVKKYINIYKRRGKDIGIPLRLNIDVDNIITTKSIANLATAFRCAGATPEDKEEPITLKGYKYDDGDFYVDTDGTLKSRKALEKWKRLLWKDGEKQQEGGHIVKHYDYDTESQATLCSHAITELKKVCDMEINFEVDIKKLPDNVKVGDRVNIVDDAGELYLSTRILTLEKSVCDQSNQAILGEHLLKKSGISEKVKKLAEQFAKNSVSALRALAIANAAKAEAAAAQSQADDALEEASKAQGAVDEALAAADQATQSAEQATQAANNAQQLVEDVEESVSGLQSSIENAQKAADDAKTAAQTADAKAQEAAQAAAQAKAEAAEAAAQVIVAEQKADTAVEKSEAAQNTANTAKNTAETAQETAAAAKLDAEQAEKDIDALGEQLTTVRTTMEADYTRKTDLTETQASLQAQITQNAAQIGTTVTRLQTVDETANNAAEQAAQAKADAAAAKAQADQASADAAEAQDAADNAALAAQNAQSEADTAKLAAETAQSVADKAEADLATAKADLATVQGRVDATEEEIEAAEAALAAAQAAADKAKTDAEAAAQAAETAQSKADKAVSDAESAKDTADAAAANAALAQQVANEAKGNAAAAQQRADEAAEIAEAAQNTANTAVTNATNAQTQANAAAQAAQDAQDAADAAEAKAQQAASDLATAEQNLANVTSRVDATEEEVEAAQAAVEAAQQAAQTAQSEADAAQQTADQAKADAEAAQAVADAAQHAADEAQQAADEAQKAADDAQAAVDALEIRVSETETQIRQTSEYIKLLATKTEVTETLGGYYTKEETLAEIQIESDAIQTTVKQAQTTADAASATASESSNRVTITESEIQQLANMIATLVTDGAGASLMTQTENGWTFSVGSMVDSINKTADDVGLLSGDVDGLESSLGSLQTAVNDLGVLASYIVIGEDENGQPYIELGESDSDFKLRITNTEIQFADGTAIPAYMTNQKLYIEKAEIKDELQFGGFVWKIRQSGNMGLIWKGVDQ